MLDTQDSTSENPRQQRGIYIAAMFKIKRQEDQWIVPSQTNNSKSYKVDLTLGTCTCPDYETRQVKCKHQFAVEIVLIREQSDGTTKVTRAVQMTYRQDWSTYNTAQAREGADFMRLLHDLCDTIPQPAYIFGRPRLPISDRVFAATLKVYSTMSARRFASDLTEAHAKGYITHIPHFNAPLKALKDASLTPILKELIWKSSLPLLAIETKFAVDSTAFTTCRFVRWFDEKYGKVRHDYQWLKGHVICGVKSNIIVAAEISAGNENDSPFLPKLLEAVIKGGFTIEEVSADKGYTSKSNLAAIVAAGGTPYIPFKTNVVPPDPSTLWGKMYYFFHLHRDEFLEHYHLRSNVETVFSMVKGKFGDAVRSRHEPSQTNEVLAKFLCHNLCVIVQSMYRLGIDPDFRQDHNAVIQARGLHLVK